MGQVKVLSSDTVDDAGGDDISSPDFRPCELKSLKFGMKYLLTEQQNLIKLMD